MKSLIIVLLSLTSASAFAGATECKLRHAGDLDQRYQSLSIEATSQGKVQIGLHFDDGTSGTWEYVLKDGPKSGRHAGWIMGITPEPYTDGRAPQPIFIQESVLSGEGGIVEFASTGYVNFECK